MDKEGKITNPAVSRFYLKAYGHALISLISVLLRLYPPSSTPLTTVGLQLLSVANPLTIN